LLATSLPAYKFKFGNGMETTIGDVSLLQVYAATAVPEYSVPTANNKQSIFLIANIIIS